jgi:DNA-binding CsgD family transcriptional regulator
MELKKVSRCFSGCEILVDVDKISKIWTTRHCLTLGDLSPASRVIPPFDLSFLTKRQAQVVKLLYFKRLSTRQAAALLNISQPTVISHAFFAKKKIRKLLGVMRGNK